MDLDFTLNQTNEATAELIEALADAYAVRAEEPKVRIRTYYDTYDWLLYQASLALYRAGDEYTLVSLTGERSAYQALSDRTAVFAADLPASELQSTVQPIIKVRALLEMAEVQVQSTTLRVLNDDEKTVARVICNLIGDHSTPLHLHPVTDAHITISAVRGYEKSADHAATCLQDKLKLQANAANAEADVFRIAMSQSGQTPGGYSSSLDLQLAPDMRTVDAAVTIFRRLLDVMRANEDGIRKDIDSEFLHDYRVAIRRTRSALSQIRDVFSPQETERWKQEFRLVGQSTNALRDLDVYLIAEREYRAMLPATLQTDIAPLFEYLRSQRAQALQEVVEALDDADRVRVLEEWDAFLHAAPSAEESGAKADLPVLALASQQIYKRYKQIIKSGKPLLVEAEDARLHQLRIDCKKLRYLLEFFESLYPPKEIKLLVRELKRLQDNLGEFNDLSVQQDYLLGMAKNLSMDDERTGPALIATGALVQVLVGRQERAKGEFSERFSAFASEVNRNLYRELFLDRDAGEPVA